MPSSVRRPLRTLLAAAGLLVLPAAQAQVTVADPWVRASVGQTSNTAAFMTLSSAQAARLVRAESPAAGRVEVHESTVVDGVMRMRRIEAVEVPAGTPVRLQPGGLHVMLLDLRRGLKEGDKVPLTLHFEVNGTPQDLVLTVPVRPIAAGAGGMSGMDHAAHMHPPGEAAKKAP